MNSEKTIDQTHKKDAAPAELVAAVDSIVKYIWGNARSNFYICPKSGNPRHIFQDIRIVNEWLEQLRK
jgi:hypothetical protein